jgi:hypothetical protein
MKNKISRILGVGLSAILLASLLVVASPAAPASAAPLGFSGEPGPHNGMNPLGGVVMPGFEIEAMAVNGDTIYVATTGPDLVKPAPPFNEVVVPADATFKSTDGGATWSYLTFETPDFDTTEFQMLAVAPDDPNEVVAVDEDDRVLYSSNGGATWGDTVFTGNAIYDIDISEGPVRTIAVAGTDGALGELWLYEMRGMFPPPAWREKAEAGAGPNPTPNGFITDEEINAVKFSPNYATDKMVLCVSSMPVAGGYAHFQVYWEESKYWNDMIQISGFEFYTEPRLQIIEIDAGEALNSASLAVPGSYMGYDEFERIAYIGLASSENDVGEEDKYGGAYRNTDGSSVAITEWDGTAPGPINSVAYHDAGKLLAGDYDNNLVFSCVSPLDREPAFERVNSMKQPGGEDGEPTLVGWSGDTAVAAGYGNESAFAASTDDGYAFNDISMINTEIMGISDFAVNADGSKLYMTTRDDNVGDADVSVWVKAPGFQRVLSIHDSDNPMYLARISPDDDAVVYLSSVGTNDMWVSKNSGMTTWKNCSCYKLDEVFDFAVLDEDTVYAIGPAPPAMDISCSKTTNAGTTWGMPTLLGTATGHTEGARVILAPNGDILVGGSDGSYAVSSDEGATFAYNPPPPGPPAPEVYLAPDPSYAANGIIYIAQGTSVRRSGPPPPPGQSISPTYYDMDGDDDVEQVITGIAVFGEGGGAPPGPPPGGSFQPPPGPPGPAEPPAPPVVYVLSASADEGVSVLNRCLNLQTADYAGGKNAAEWSYIYAPAPGDPPDPVILDVCPQALKITSYVAGPPPMPGQPPPGPPPGPPPAPPAPKLWAINTFYTPGPPAVKVGALCSMTDPLALVSPTVTGPEDKFEVEVNPRSGAAYDTTFSWQRQVTEVSRMQIQIATDPEFDALLVNAAHDVNTDTVPAIIGPTASGIWGIQTSLMPGKTYYWRVRCIEVKDYAPWYSPWSDARELNVLGAIAFDIQSPVPGSTGVTITPTLVWTEFPGALHYEIEIAEEPTLATIELFSVLDIVHSSDQTFYKVEDEEALKYSTTYYWRVRAITGVAPPAPPGPPGGPPPPPAPSSEWLVGVFTTEAEPVEEEPTEIIVESPPVTVQPPDVTVEAPAAAIPAYLLWTIVGIGAVLLIALIVLIVRTRRVV